MNTVHVKTHYEMFAGSSTPAAGQCKLSIYISYQYSTGFGGRVIAILRAAYRNVSGEVKVCEAMDEVF